MEVEIDKIRQWAESVTDPNLNMEILYNSQSERLMVKITKGPHSAYGWGVLYNGHWWLTDGGLFLRDLLTIYPCDCLKVLREEILPVNFHISHEIALVMKIMDVADPFLSLVAFIFQLGEIETRLKIRYNL